MLQLGAVVGIAIAAWTWYQVATAANVTDAAGATAVSFAVWALVWVALPLMAGSGGDPLQPDLFRLLPIPPRRLAFSLLGASAVGVLPLVTFVAFASLVLVGAPLGPAAAVVSLVGACVSLAFVIASSRVVVQWMGMAVESRLGLELAAIQYALLICLSFIWLPIGVVAAQGGTGGGVLMSLPPPGEVARALPTGWSTVAVEAAGRGDWLLVVGALAGLTGLTVGIVVVWAGLLARRLRGESASHARRFRPASVWNVRRLVPSTPLGAVVGKELRAWARHPRRSLQLRVAFWSALMLTVVPGLFGARAELWPWTGAVFAVVATIGFANVYGMDGSSLWLTLVTETARDDVRGRQTAWLVAVGLPAVLVTIAFTALAGDPAAWPWVLAVLPALVGASTGGGPLLAVLLPASLPERRGGNPLELGDAPTTAGRLMMQGLVVTLLTPLMAVPAGLVVWLSPSPAHWFGVVVGLITGGLYAWGFGRGAAAYLSRHGPELMDQMRMRANPVARASARSVKAGAPTSGSALAAIASGVLATVGIILLVPQGIVALTFSLADSDVKSWFVARYLPDELQVPASVMLAIVGGLILLAAWLMRSPRAIRE